MSGLTTEVLIFEASDEFRKDPGIATPASKVVLKSKGVHGPVYCGKQVEEPGTWGSIVLRWDNIEAHKAVMESPSYAKILDGLKPALAPNAKVEMHHVKFPDPTIALEQPITEILILSLKKSENRKAVVRILSSITEASKNMLVFGQTIENENKYILLGGWESPEAHLRTMANPGKAQAVEKLYALADRNHLYHTQFVQYGL